MGEHDSNNQVHDGNDQQDNPPKWLPHDFQQDDTIVDGNDSRPSWLSRFLECLLHADDDNDKDDEVQEHDESVSAG